MLPRRSVLAGGLAAPFLLRRAHGQAAQFTIKVGSGNFPGHPSITAMEKVVQRVREQSGGRVEMQIFASSQLGNDSQMTSQVRSGALECFIGTDAVLSAVAPATSLCNIGFAFADYPTVWKAMDGALGSHVREQVAKIGLHVFGRSWDNGFRQITTGTKPVQTVEDLSGFKIRVPPSPLSLSLFKALGAAPVSINYSELYSALQTRLVDGQDNSVAQIESAKLFEVQKFCSLTSHTWDGIWIVMNKGLWDQIPPDLQAVLTKVIDDAALEQRALSETQNEELKAALTAKGMAFNSPDKESFKAALRKAGFYADWRKRLGDQGWRLLEEAAGSLG